jgi:hypothetical protein
MTGLLPFSSLSNYVVITKVTSGGRPERPKDFVAAARLTDDIWNVTERCWRQQPDERLEIDKVLELLNTASRFWNPQTQDPASTSTSDSNLDIKDSVPSEVSSFG